VEAEFEGSPGAVDKMLDWCRQGTDWSQVENVEVTEEEPKGEQGFTVEG
jgi:acylphosphatase